MSDIKRDPLIEHLESYLGKISNGWVLSESTNAIQVARFVDKPVEKTSTYVTLGLSRHILKMPHSREVRQELVFSAHNQFNGGAIASFLLTFCDFLLTKHDALLRGQVIGPDSPVIPGIKMDSIYSSIPVLLEDSFATCERVSPPIVFVWVFPLYASEASYVENNGWNNFEDLLEKNDPDLLDLNRLSIV